MASMLTIKGNREFLKWWSYWMERVDANRRLASEMEKPPPSSRRPIDEIEVDPDKPTGR